MMGWIILRRGVSVFIIVNISVNLGFDEHSRRVRVEVMAD